MADEILQKVDPSESVQKAIRIPGHLWNRLVDAALHEGSQTFTAFAHTAIAAKVNKTELEIAAKKKAVELLAADLAEASRKKTK